MKRHFRYSFKVQSERCGMGLISFGQNALFASRLLGRAGVVRENSRAACSQDLDTAVWFAREVQPHENKLRSYLRGIAAAADIDDLVQESYAEGKFARRADCCSRLPVTRRAIFFAGEP
jgi:hypothetical protein